MANRRMFSMDIVDSDAFLEMPLSTQALYFQLGMRADDEGFLNNAKKIQRMIGASEDDLKLLVAKRFVLAFESGIYVIKHWKMNNYLRSDRFKPTQYEEEKAMLSVKTNGAYTLGIPNGNQRYTQHSIAEHSIDKVSIDKNSIVKHSIEEMLSPDEREFLEQTYKNIEILYDCIDRRGNLENIKKPLNYIVSIANQEGWKTY